MNVKEEYSSTAAKYKLSEESLRKREEMEMSHVPKASETFSLNQYKSSIFASNLTESKDKSLLSGLNACVKVIYKMKRQRSPGSFLMDFMNYFLEHRLQPYRK